MKKWRSISCFIIPVFLISILFGLKTLRAETKIEIRDIDPKQIEMRSFTVERPAEITIEAIVGYSKNPKNLSSDCWILNCETRNVVWTFSSRSAEVKRSREYLEQSEKLHLDKGDYEIYYAINPFVNQIRKKILGILPGSKTKKIRYAEYWGVVLSVENGDEQILHEFDSETQENQAIVQIDRVGDDKNLKQGFVLTAPVKVRIYAIGEGTHQGREMYDFGWILNTEIGERVWEMRYRETEHAGGAQKNRKADEKIMLPAGTYTVHYVTDDSHSFEEWNEKPPYDPSHWGITVWAMDTEQAVTAIKPYDENVTEQVIAKLDHVRDTQFVSAGFKLLEESTLRITAVGEYAGSRNQMADYGWIVDAKSRKTVWRMNYSETEYAGGGRKNRMFDGYIFFPAGTYLIYYRTDDSHAFRSWNVHEPWQPEAWGITVRCAKKDCDPKIVQDYFEEEDSNILAQLIRVRNSAKKSKAFHVTSSTDVKIFAIGEGRDGRMFDYGWIESVEGDVIWKMDFYRTEHAGGGAKNRLANENISLYPGTYTVYFQTDDSHSYEGWNTAPPAEYEEYWGITIIKQ